MNCEIDRGASANGGAGSSSPFTAALMQEVTSLLEGFVINGTQGMIDLRGLPMRDIDKQQLEQLLGVGDRKSVV